MMARGAIAIMLCALIAPAHAQTWPDARMRVEIRYERPDTKSGANFARVRETQCRESVIDPATDKELRRRIVSLALREWEAFHFPVLDIASDGQPLVPSVPSRGRSLSLVPNAINAPLAEPLTRALRLGLVEDDNNAIARIGGYWAVVPGQGAIAAQNVIWGKGGWPGAGWAQPWSAAFMSWTMCEAGLTRAQFPRSATHAAYVATMFDAAARPTFAAKPLSTPLAPGDLVCAGRADDKDIASLDDAKRAAEQGALMHCDIVVGSTRDRALLVGGNVMNAVALTIAPTDRRGHIKPNARRSWFGVMQLQAPQDQRAGLREMDWACLGKEKDVMACLERR